MTESRRHDLLAIAVLVAIPSLLFLDVLLGWGVFYLRDVPFYHFPGKKILRDIVLGGEFPYWNAYVSAGQPLAANPAHEVFYPLTWLILLPSYLYGFQLLALSHVYLATLSTYALLRSLGTTRTAAVVGGLSFGLGGFVLSGLHFFPFLFSAAWMPLTCLFTRRFLIGRAPRDFALAAAAFGMQVLVGEPVTILQTGFLLGMYALFRGERRLSEVAFVGAISLAALLVSAVQTIPMLDHFGDSVRANGFEWRIVGDWSTPPLRFVEVLYPSFLGAVRQDTADPYWGINLFGERGGPFFLSIYSGLLVAACAFAGLFGRLRGRWLYLSICAASVVLSLGGHTPLFRWLYDAGLARSIRYPEKFVIMGIFATVVFGALGFDAIVRGEARMRKLAIGFAVAVALFAVGAFAFTYTAPAVEVFRSLFRLGPQLEIPSMLAFSRTGWLVAAVKGLLLAALFALIRRRAALRVVSAVAVLFVAADAGMFVPEVAPRVPPAFYTDPPRVVHELAPNRGDYRIFHLHEWSQQARNKKPYLARRPHLFVILRNALGGLSPATYGFRGVMEVDYDLTSLAVTDDFVRAAWELRDRSKDWLNYVAAMSNIRYIGLFRPLEPELAAARGDVRYIRPTRFIEGLQQPRYYFATQIVTARTRQEFVDRIAAGGISKQAALVDAPSFTPAPGRVLRWSETANTARIDVEAAGDAFLVMSVTPHKYWLVTIDGVEVPAIVANRGYQGVLVPRGRHVVEMRYHNPLIAAGGAISLAALVAVLFAARNAAGRMRAL
ncbi:MAG TPA: hypothetical protein VE974_01735 [Thermoanaerobaculia bacterium]|nr:hypothetical protein [Thermoanaerobaculia bacterium]